MSQVLVTESYLSGIADAIRGRNGTQNTYTPSQMAAAVTAIPNTYAAGDEGKVVDNGALVAQDSLSVSENGTYDTTKKNSVTVNVSGGGNVYTHSVTLSKGTDSLAKTILVTSDNTSFTLETLLAWLTSKGFTNSTSGLYPAIGHNGATSTANNHLKGLYADGNYIRIVAVGGGTSAETFTVSDLVAQV